MIDERGITAEVIARWKSAEDERPLRPLGLLVATLRAVIAEGASVEIV